MTHYHILKEDVKVQQKEIWNLTEDHIINDMQTVDKVYLYFDEVFSESMEVESRKLRAYYEINPDIYSWDIDAIKERTNMEFYIIDEQNKIVVTTYEPSKGIDFELCCEKFSNLLDERRMSDVFFSDGIDNSVTTKALWKYSYLATSDHKYILEFGVPLEDTEIFQQFNFFETAKKLEEKYEDVLEIKIFSSEGFVLASRDNKESIDDMPDFLQQAYEQAVATSEPTQIEHDLGNGKVEIHRFLPYFADTERGNSTERIIYTKYNNNKEQTMLKEATQQVWMIVIVAVVTSLILLFVILKILNTTIHLATYDTLTNLYNRASYLYHIQHLLDKGSSTPIGLLLIDLDNFKQVNDQFGHTAGDDVLKTFAKVMRQASQKGDYCVRYGGDEFAIVLEHATEEKLEKLATHILQGVQEIEETDILGVWSILSVSIGGTMQRDATELEEDLFVRADKALYEKKKDGKDGYSYLSPFNNENS